MNMTNCNITFSIFRMLNAFAEEAATEDAIYYLAEGLRSGIIDLDAFLKQVRQLSRRQFMLRALMQRCRQKAGLAGWKILLLHFVLEKECVAIFCFVIKYLLLSGENGIHLQLLPVSKNVEDYFIDNEPHLLLAMEWKENHFT